MTSMPLFEPPPPRVLSVQQPWAMLIVTGLKTIENRTWKTEYRGPLYIHAGKRMHVMPVSEIEQRHDVTIDPESLQLGAIIGRVDLIDIVTRSNDPYFAGPYGWVLRNAELLTPIPLRGMQGLFNLPAGVTPQPAFPR